uniref:Uncharacterized protein n=1 Tax=Anguilla anguilla TaxID=7936 RepID=A0A0E9TMQ1_ANGAN
MSGMCSLIRFGQCYIRFVPVTLAERSLVGGGRKFECVFQTPFYHTTMQSNREKMTKILTSVSSPPQRKYSELIRP